MSDTEDNFFERLTGAYEDDEERDQPLFEVLDGEAPNKKSLDLLRGTWLDPRGQNFMGSGLDFFEYMASMDMLRFSRWMCAQPREERRRRMGYIIKLCAEQERLVEADIHATGISQSCIEAIIEGDWPMVKAWIESLTFSEDPAKFRSMQAKRFERFREIAQQAYDTRPRVFCPVCIKPTPKNGINAHPDSRHVCPWCRIVFDANGNWVEQSKAHLATAPEED